MANYDLTYEGSRVQGILDTGNSLKDAGYIFRGEATPSTVPGTPTERVAYIGGPGTYTNFGGSITVGAGCICVFKYTGSAWSNQVINTGLDSAVNTLQSAITAINNNIGNGYVYAGVATPSTSPVTGKVFYLAVQAGTYTNFGNAVVTAGLNVIKYNGSAWSVDQLIAIDAEPTQGSANLVKSGGVLNSIIQNGPAFDLSAYNAQGGVLATYADLSAALTALNALPADFKKGGMSVKFVQTSDNNYVQYRYIGTAVTGTPNPFLNTDNWVFCDEGVWVESSEFMAVYLDADKRIIKATKIDGTEYFAVGVEAETFKVFNGAEVHGSINTDATEITMLDSPEFMIVHLTNDNRILYGIQKDGNFFFGCGVPKQVIGYVEKRIAELSLDEYEDIVTFLDGLEKGEKTLSQLLAEKADTETIITALATKVDKVEGKSLIDTDVADSIHYVDSSEFISVELDYNNRIVKATKKDGTEYYGAGIDIANVATEKPVDSSEFFGVFLDGRNHIIMAFAHDGNVFFGIGVPKQIKYYIDKEINRLGGDINAIQTFIAGFETGTTLIDYLNDIYGEYVNSLEYIEVEADSDKRVLGGRRNDGRKFENVGYDTPNISVDGVKVDTIDDKEGRLSLCLDSEKKVISYRSKDGILHENAGVDTPNLEVKKSFKLKDKAKDEFVTDIKASMNMPYMTKKFNLPDYGSVDIVCELYYLGTDNKEYNPTKVTKVNDTWYVTKTLTEVIDPETGEKSYEVNENSIATTYTEIDVDMEDTTRWPVDKTKHYCKVAMKFGGIDGTWYATVAFQGASTLTQPKKGLRITTYKKSDFAKKDKIKIGEMIATSKFNVKAYYGDPTRMRDVILERLIIEARNLREYPEQYPWNGDYPFFTAAVGTIQSFPVRLSTSGNFYGVSMMGLAKDKANFMLDGDADGMIISGDIAEVGGVTHTCSFSEFDPYAWTDEMNDEEDLTDHNHTPSNYAALTAFFDWIQNGDWTKSDVAQHLSVIDWIDYYLFAQVFRMRDNDVHNLILFSKADKVKFYAFLYDLDLSWGRGYEGTSMPIDNPSLILWKKFVDVYWNEIVDRYKYLRSTVLNYNHVANLIASLQASIPYSDLKDEMEKWDAINYTNATALMLNSFNKAIKEFDLFFIY